MFEPIRFGMVGAGHIARTHAEAFSRSEIARLEAVADIRREAAQELAEASGCRGYGSYASMADAEDLDAVVVCSPPFTHPEVCIDFLARRVHVLCEKPLSIDVESARKMADAATEAGVLLRMSSKFRYVDDVVYARSIVASGILGEIWMFENAFTGYVDMGPRWNSDPGISGGGVLMDNGPHSLDLLRYFFGPLSGIEVSEGKRVQGLPVEETVRVCGRTRSGILGSIDLSWSTAEKRASYIDIYGSEGAVSVGWQDSKYRLKSGRDWVVFGRGYDKVSAFVRQVDNFSRAIRGGEKLRTTLEDAVASVEAVCAGYRALSEGGWVPVGAARTGRDGRGEAVRA